jgi:lipopolysaccharide transport system ATP-binding protein
MDFPNELAIKVDHISKCYRIGLKEKRNENFASALVQVLKSPITNFRQYRALYKFDDVGIDSDKFSEQSDLIWALKNISFEVKKGEIVGIIGRNGAGKSTLLKVLCKITHPTKGIAQIRGRISSLLEVGTGFHQELTGRENVYLNGTILGMTKKEVERKFDKIVDFSGIEKFIDTPVKRYSSGMRVRLGFAVAAYLEPEVLIVDEVLAVGDADFQKKCIDKMQDAGRGGRTVLFVSHNMSAITRLCDRAILINDGMVADDGPAPEVVGRYLTSDLGTSAAREWHDPKCAPAGQAARLIAVRVRKNGGNITESIDISENFTLEMEYEVIEDGHLLLPHFQLINNKGITVFVTMEQDSNWQANPWPKGFYLSKVRVPGNLMAEGTFIANCGMLSLKPEKIQFFERSAVAFTVVASMEGDTARSAYKKNIAGVVRPSLEWETKVNNLRMASMQGKVYEN